jgi:hypothetical protein
MEKMTLKDFMPDGIIDLVLFEEIDLPRNGKYDSLLDKRIYYGMELAGLEGARFWLFREEHHTEEDIKIAKRYLKCQRDVIGRIQTIKEKKE